MNFSRQQQIIPELYVLENYKELLNSPDQKWGGPGKITGNNYLNPESIIIYDFKE